MVTTDPPRIEPSATVRMGDTVRELQSRDVDVINLGSGSPDFVTPDHITDAAKRALSEGHTQMGMTAGLPKLREAIAEKFTDDNEIGTEPASIGVTPGSKFALFAAITELIREGDEVVLFDPSWVSYEAMVDLAGGDLHRVPLDPEDGFSLGNNELSEQVSDNTRALIINNPVNPTGTVFSRAELEEIRDLAVDHDFWVIADEIYEKLIHEGEHCSIGSLAGMSDRTVTINGFSKAYAMSGWRLGYFTAPQPVVDAMQAVQSQTVSSPTIFAQHGAVAALEGPQEPVEEMRQIYESRIGTAIDIIEDAGGTVSRPSAAFYLFVPVGTDDDVTLAETILDEQQVATTPGSAFGVSGYLRLACTIPEERIKDGVTRLTKSSGVFI